MRNLLHRGRQRSSCYHSWLGQRSGCWWAQATIWANQGNPNFCTWIIRNEVLYAHSNFQDGPESTGHGFTQSLELALCPPASKMSTLPTCLHVPPLMPHSWQHFCQQKADPVLSKEHTGQVLTRRHLSLSSGSCSELHQGARGPP